MTTPNLLDRLNLTPADLGDVTDVTRRYGNQAGVAHALRVWRRVNPSRATFRALVEIAIGLRRGDTATDICRFIVMEDVCLKKEVYDNVHDQRISSGRLCFLFCTNMCSTIMSDQHLHVYSYTNAVWL